MYREIVRAGLLIGALMMVTGIPLLLIVPPGSAEQVITLFTVLIGIVSLTALVIFVRIHQR